MKILGHSVHPILIVFPLGLLATSVAFDIIHVIYGDPSFATVSFWLIAAGLIGGLLAALTGWIDWFGIPSNTRAKKIGLTHGLVNAVVLTIFAISLVLRTDYGGRSQTTAFVVSIGGFVLAMVGGWLGGELVERLGVSVHSGANFNAPSSLTTERIGTPISTPRKV